ncbi:hypothetical protein appser6_20790 [Actinobacillus pleuropneumoniae serovar 6 str. Femo]|uniref:Uncharacterized protein n=1 Tax=Actinobacillus pleuropneumoniae serovar 6 str. Femo TaxID=754256 RepID=A0A828PI23_ACTPL|nr:hypothetical protein appser2_19340 [Actinobacillus pleuropneumoniae serovar 2 str. S1536]EFM91013.1 hypothetical protein appser6_20790 [Actinobacillus pleuropneumoniae serovar 6 str. Femo]
MSCFITNDDTNIWAVAIEIDHLTTLFTLGKEKMNEIVSHFTP